MLSEGIGGLPSRTLLTTQCCMYINPPPPTSHTTTPPSSHFPPPSNPPPMRGTLPESPGAVTLLRRIVPPRASSKQRGDRCAERVDARVRPLVASEEGGASDHGRRRKGAARAFAAWASTHSSYPDAQCARRIPRESGKGAGASHQDDCAHLFSAARAVRWVYRIASQPDLTIRGQAC